MKESKVTIMMLAMTLAVICTTACGAGDGMSNLAKLSEARTRCISPENMTGEPGKGAMADPNGKLERNVNNAAGASQALGKGWKVNPYLLAKPGEKLTIADVDGPGTIQHIWMTLTGKWRWTIIRIYWDGEETPSVEVPAADFFCQGWNVYAPVNSAAVCVNPGSAFNCYWPMPFRRHFKMTVENVNPTQELRIYYYIDYEKAEVAEDQAYFHAQFRTTRWNETSDFTILDGVRGKGHYVGTYLAWEVHNTGWWGEGETKFFIDGDSEFPTLCSTGLEDYFCGSYNFDRDGKYKTYCTPYAGLRQVVGPEEAYKCGQRFGLYRWHIMDPVRFKKELKLTIQDIGWRHDLKYLKQHSGISSTAFWYQTEPHAKFPKLPSREDIEVL